MREILDRRPVLHLHVENRQPSAVLVPIYYQVDRFYLLFTRRTHLVRHHKGEISFPGGAFAPADGSLLNTALRESQEEIGIAAEDVKVLGGLDEILTRGSPFIITPFIGTVRADYRYTLSHFEIAELIHVPVDALLQPGCRRDETEVWVDGRLLPAYVYTYGINLITGATARILKQFLEIYQQAL